MTSKRSKAKTTRQPHQIKQVKKGEKSRRGVPELYSELKKSTSVGLTPTAIQGLDEICKEMNISRSELVERIGRKLLKVTPCTPEA